MKVIKVKPHKKGVPVHVPVNKTKRKIIETIKPIQETINEPQVSREEETPDRSPVKKGKKRSKRKAKRSKITTESPRNTDK